MQRRNATAAPVPGKRRCRMRGLGESRHGHESNCGRACGSSRETSLCMKWRRLDGVRLRLQSPSIGGWPRLFHRLFQFHRSVGVRDFLANFPTPSPHALGNGMSDRLEICLAGLVESLRGWSVWPGTGPITTLESSTFNARRTRIVRRGFGVGRSSLDVRIRSRQSDRLIVSE